MALASKRTTQSHRNRISLPDKERKAMLRSAESLFACYERLQKTKQHLLSPVLNGESPKQWAHYPDDDVIDKRSGYQYFYHSHSPDDRPDAAEHGHFHLFARLDGGVHVIDAAREKRFLSRLNSAFAKDSKTASLLCVSLDASGVPTSLFTVNRWVTGDHLLSADATLALLKEFHLETPGFELISEWTQALIGLFWPQIVELLEQRDHKLECVIAAGHSNADLLDDNGVELLSEYDIDIDQQVERLHASQ